MHELCAPTLDFANFPPREAELQLSAPATYAAPGTEVLMETTVEHHRKLALARVAPLPFFDPSRKRS